MIRTYHRTKDGSSVSEQEAIDARGCIKDGFTMRTKLTLMDGVPLTDEQKFAALEARRGRISDAWRNPNAQFADARPAPAPAAGASVYDRRDQKLQNAWKHAS
jgi:hypothetical protein